MERLDKIISSAGICSRKECGRLGREGRITVDGQVVRMLDTKVDESAVIAVDGQVIARHRDVVCIMNKPAGFVTSTEDDRSRTVMELLSEDMLRQKVVPAGRLDKDTEGLLVFTNNGDLLHRIISPKSGISKTYYVVHDGLITEHAVKKAQEGIVLKDGTVCKPARIDVLSDGRSDITITEGMYHQVKRMFAALGCHVTYLRRIRIGGLSLGDLRPSQVRELEPDEVRLLVADEKQI